MPMTDEIKVAIQRGWKIFPLVHHSRFAFEQPLLKQATSSIKQIKEWLNQYPDCRWAVSTGKKSGIFAVEFTSDLGIETVRSLCAGDFTGMDTLQIRTEKRITTFFNWPGTGMPASRRGQLAEGILIRQSGGYVELPVAPDTIGSQSTYSNPTATIQDAPGWLLELLNSVLSKHRPADVIPFSPLIASTLSVGLSFALRDGMWVCDFYAMEEGGALIKTLPFRFSSTILRLAERGGVAMDADTKEWLNTTIQKRTGNLLLTLTKWQYEKLLAA